MKYIYATIVATLLFANFLQAQNTYNIKGIVTDTLKNPLIQATTLLLNKTDSTMIDYGRSEMDGSFKFKNVEPGNYLVKATYIGYLPLMIKANVVDQNINLDSLKMSELANELMEVVIKEAKASITMRGDTIEYDVSTFQVPEGSTVEGLLRRLPGIELGQDGSVKADGKDVNNVTVDGKQFFSSDPKVAIKNLAANAISKVQVYDTETEEEEATGLNSQSDDKTMNLELKDEYKKGGFGKILGGVGTKSRAELKGNYNKFNEKIQFSIVGVGNNTGRNGLSWNDYRDFMGSQSFNFSGGSTYGFGGGGRRYLNFSGGGNSVESSIRSLFFGGSDNGGFPESYNGGVSLNYDHEKTKVSGVYYSNYLGLERENKTNRQNFFDDSNFNETENETTDNATLGHRAEISIEQEIDSLHTLKLYFNGAVINEDNEEIATLNIDKIDSLGTILSNTTTNLKNNNLRDGYLGRSSFVFNKKFKKKGRSFGVNGAYLFTRLEDLLTQNSNSAFFKNGNVMPDSIGLTNQLTKNNADKHQTTANAIYVEPLSKRIFAQVFYNFDNRLEIGERSVENLIGTTSEIDNALSRTFENKIVYQRIGTSLRYAHDGVNLSAGLAYQMFNLFGQYNKLGENMAQDSIDTNFNNFIPYISIDVSPSRNFNFDISYSRRANQPSINDLQPIVNNTNPLYIREGNTALLPEIVNGFDANVSRNWVGPAIRLYMYGSYNFFENQFSTSQVVDENNVTRAKPINIEDGGSRANIGYNFSFPIKKNKVTVSTYGGYNYSNKPALVNDITNLTTTNSTYNAIRFNITPSDKFSLYLNYRNSFADTKYDINSSQNQKILSNEIDVEFNTKLIYGLFLNTNFTQNYFTNKRYNFNESVPILNVSLYKQFFEKKQLETRISIYDAFNKDRAINQNAFGNTVSQSETTAIGRYVMLSITYNILGLTDGIKRKGWW